MQKLTLKAVQASESERRLYKACLRTCNDPRQSIFIDETTVGINTSRRNRGWGRRGHPVAKYSLYQGDDKDKGDASAQQNGFQLASCTFLLKKGPKMSIFPCFQALPLPLRIASRHFQPLPFSEVLVIELVHPFRPCIPQTLRWLSCVGGLLFCGRR